MVRRTIVAVESDGALFACEHGHGRVRVAEVVAAEHLLEVRERERERLGGGNDEDAVVHAAGGLCLSTNDGRPGRYLRVTTSTIPVTQSPSSTSGTENTERSPTHFVGTGTYCRFKNFVLLFL